MHLRFLGFWISPCGTLTRILAVCLFPLVAGWQAARGNENPESAPAIRVSLESHDASSGNEMPADEAGSAAAEEELEEVFPTDEQVFAWFSAILREDFTAAKNWLDKGMDVDAPLPPNPSREFLQLITESRMLYYVTREQGVTALMLTAGMGTGSAVDFLLEQGADRFKKTKRNRTYALWLASKTGDVELMRKLMTLDAEGRWKNHKVHVSLAEQKLRLSRDGEVILESPISSGKKSMPTATGKFVVSDKHRDWKSTIYNVPMPHFVRLSCSDFGFHAGNLPGYPASRGCIRLPAQQAREFFNAIPIGALVVIEE